MILNICGKISILMNMIVKYKRKIYIIIIIIYYVIV